MGVDKELTYKQRLTLLGSGLSERLRNNIKETWGFKSYATVLQRKFHIKIELCVRLSVLRLVLVGHVEQIGEVHFSLLDTIGYRVKAKNERFTAASSLSRQNLKTNNFMKDCVDKLH